MVGEPEEPNGSASLAKLGWVQVGEVYQGDIKFRLGVWVRVRVRVRVRAGLSEERWVRFHFSFSKRGEAFGSVLQRLKRDAPLGCDGTLASMPRILLILSCWHVLRHVKWWPLIESGLWSLWKVLSQDFVMVQWRFGFV